MPLTRSEQIGDLFAANGSFSAAADAYGDADPLYMTLNQKGKLGLVLLAVDPVRSTEVLNRIVESVQPTHADDLRWRLEAGLVWAYALTGYLYDALRRGRNGLSMLNKLAGYGDSIALIRLTLGMACLYDDEADEAAEHFESAYGGWNARGETEGCRLVDAIRVGIPVTECTHLWLNYVLKPLLTY